MGDKDELEKLLDSLGVSPRETSQVPPMIARPREETPEEINARHRSATPGLTPEQKSSIYDPAYVPESARPKAPEPSAAETLARGGRQGALLGFADEIQGVGGGIGAMAAGRPFSEGYQGERDTVRAAEYAARNAHPGAYGGAEAVGSTATMVIPGMNVAKAATVAQAARTGAIVGGVAGLGASESETIKGDVAHALAGAALGATTGAVTHKIPEYMRGAPSRVENAEVGGLKENAQYSTRMKVFGNPENAARVKEIVKADPILQASIKSNPAAALARVEAMRKVEGDALGQIYESAATVHPGAKWPAVKRDLMGIARQFKTEPEEAKRTAVKEIIERMGEKFEKKGYVSIGDLHDRVSAWQNEAFSKAKALGQPTARQEIAEDIQAALRKRLQAAVDEAGTRNPISVGGDKAKLQAINRRFAGLSDARLILAEQVKRMEANAPATGNIVASMNRARTNPITTAAKAMVEPFAAPLAEATDRRLALLMEAAKTNPRAAKALQMLYGVGQQGVTANAPNAPGQVLDAIRE